jgi:hypothetical protein
MTFSDTTNKNGILQLCEQTLFGDNGFGKITDNSNLKIIFTNNVNQALDWYATLAIKYDSIWNFDDNNYTTYQEGFTDLVSGQQDYPLSIAFLDLETLEIRNSDNTEWILLKRTSDEEIKAMGQAPSEYLSTTGIPTHYKMKGNSIILLPTPNYSGTEFLKATIHRPFNYFTSTDTTATVGIPSTMNRTITDFTSWLYARDRSMQISVDLEKRVLKYEQIDIPNFYANRSKDIPRRVTPNYQNNK